MESRRRHADDFTDSLQSFRQTFSGKYDETFQVSRDSLDIDSVMEEQNKKEKHRCLECNNSSILASNLASEQFTHQIPNKCCKVAYDVELSEDSLNETSYKLLKLDLNKCINLFHNEILEKERNVCQEYTNTISTSFETKDSDDSYHSFQNKCLKSQYKLIGPLAASLDSLKQAEVSTNKIQKSKSCTMLIGDSKIDTNHNVKSCEFFVEPTEANLNNHKEMETIVSLLDKLSLSESVPLNKKDDLQSIKRDQKCNSVNSENISDDITELRTCLQSLEDQKTLIDHPNPPTIQKHMLKRLSTTFYDSPRNFTEKLLTIIEESTLSNIPESLEYPDISLRRLTEEIRKRCKFIENETAPEWPTSPGMSTFISPGEGDRKSASNSPRKFVDALRTPNKDTFDITIEYISPVTSQRNKSLKNIHWRLSRNISTALNTRNSVCDTPFDATSTFENLETYCKQLFPEEYKKSPTKRENMSQRLLQDISNIKCKCNAQMASLEDSLNVCEQLRGTVKSTVDSEKQATNFNTEIQNHLYGSLGREKHDKTTPKNESLVFKCSHAKCTNHSEIAKLDILENTLLYEIAKKRQSCLDMVKQMTEIDANPKTVGAQGTCCAVRQEKKPSSDNDVKLMETLMSCKDYNDCVKEYKPLLTLLQRTKSQSQHNKENSDTKKSIRLIDKISMSKTTLKSQNLSPKTLHSKSKLFVTPGKSPVKTPVKKTTKGGDRRYFPSLWNDKQERENIETDGKPYINSHRQNIFRKTGMNYNNVISPVGMYIRGTNPHLIKNLRPKTNEMLLTPKKKQTAQSTNPKPEMKFRLSPKQSKEVFTDAAARDENMPDNFLHPNVHYKLPLHVRTIKETEDRKVGNRINELLRSMQDKVVIRHEGRTKTVQTDYLKQPEIRYDSAEESVHIEQTARKTCYSRIQKEH